MSLRVGIALVLGVLVCAQLQAADCAEVKEISSEKLINYLKTNARTGDPKCVTEAIYTLGESKSGGKHATEVLINLLDFRRPETDREKMHVSSTRDWYPAVPALLEIGKAAVEPLITSLGNGQMSETARKNAIRAIVYLNREDPPQAVTMLKRAAVNAGTQAEAIALETGAKEAANSCSKSWKSRCEAALQKE